MDKILHHFETIGNHCLSVFTEESSFQGFLGGAKWISSTHSKSTFRDHGHKCTETRIPNAISYPWRVSSALVFSTSDILKPNLTTDMMWVDALNIASRGERTPSNLPPFPMGIHRMPGKSGPYKHVDG